MERTPNSLCITIGFVLLTVGGQPLVNYLSGDASLKTVWPSALVLLVGISLIIVGFVWHPKPNGENRFVQTLSRWSASPVPYTLLIVFILVYFETLAVQRNIELATLRNDEQSITEALNRFVLPRQLTSRQIDGIAGILKDFPAQEVVFNVVQGDEEADSYRADIQRALERGGWHTRTINRPESLPNDGLVFGFQRATGSPQGDIYRPDPLIILHMAFGLAGVQEDGENGGGGTENLVIISISHRRKDAYALPIPPPR